MRICKRTHQGKRLSTGCLVHHIRKQRSTFKFYVAGALKFGSIRIYLDKIENILYKNGFATWSPYKDADVLSNEDLKDATKVKETSEKDIVAFHECDGAIFLLDGYHIGTAFELGYAYYLARNIKKTLSLLVFILPLEGKKRWIPWSNLVLKIKE